jgi:hypothetical protein
MNKPHHGRSGSGVVVLLAIGGLVILALGLRSCVIDLPGMPFVNSHSLMNNSQWFGRYSLFGIGGLIQVGLAIWVGMDAERRGMNGWLWGLLVLFTFIVGLIVYLIVGQTMLPRGGTTTFARAEPPLGGASPKPPNPPASATATHRCHGCHSEIQPEYKLCPHCGHSLRCRECDEPLTAGWKLCPQCGTPIPGGPSPSTI